MDTQPITPTFARSFSSYLDKEAIPQETVAKRTGLQQSAISRYKRYIDPTATTVQRIAQGLGVDIVFRSTGAIHFVHTEIEVTK